MSQALSGFGRSQPSYAHASPRGLVVGDGCIFKPERRSYGQAQTKKAVIIWCGDGRVRGSVHLYNDNEDVEIFAQIELLENTPSRPWGLTIFSLLFW
jgi:hypothetical protein